MNEKEVKRNADEMALKIFEYINSAIPDREKRDRMLIELATSFVTVTIDVNSDDYIRDINNKCNDIKMISLGGILRYKSGDTSKVMKAFERNE